MQMACHVIEQQFQDLEFILGCALRRHSYSRVGLQDFCHLIQQQEFPGRHSLIPPSSIHPYMRQVCSDDDHREIQPIRFFLRGFSHSLDVGMAGFNMISRTPDSMNKPSLFFG